MLSNLPQRLPFGLLGDEPKLAFRSQASGITKLATTRNISDKDSYWDQYFTLFDSASDVFSLILPHDIRRALHDAPENVATLLRVTCLRLFNLVSDHTFPTAPNASVAAFASSFMKVGTSDRNATKEALNCIRLLQRVLPVVFEAEEGLSRFEMDLFWKKEVVQDEYEVEENTAAAQFVIEDDEDDEDGGMSAVAVSPVAALPPPGSIPTKAAKSLPSLAERLFSCIIDLLFCCGFTLPSKIQVDHHKINYVIWEKGIGSTTDFGPNQAYDTNKSEVLRLLLVLLSRQIYVAPVTLLSKPSFYSLHFVQRTPRRHVLAILCSLINSALGAEQGGGGGGSAQLIGGMAGKLPYNHLVFKGDTRSTLVGFSLQVLLALLDFQSGNAKDVVVGEGEQQTAAPTIRTNAFRYFLAKLHRTQDFAFLIEGVVGILKEHMASVNNLLPGSKKSVPYVVETVLFFWKLIELNKKFRAYVLESEQATEIVAYLLAYSIDIKDKPQQHGTCRALSYIVQTLSAETSFGFKLSSPVKIQIPARWAEVGNMGDFVILSIYSIVATTSGTLTSIYPALIIVLANSAPYFKHLSVPSSTRLIQLFKAFANPSFLLADEAHPRLLFYMLETFNSVILHNLSDNPTLIYGILRAQASFEALGVFTLAKGLRDIRRVQQAKDGEAPPDAKGKDRVDSDRDDDARDQKPRLPPASLETESTEDLRPAMRSSDSLHDAVSTRPLMSPTPSSFAVNTPSPASPSQRAMGKMRARRSVSMDSNLERMAAAGIGRNGFVPTQDWVSSWQESLPLDPVMLVISELLPKVHAIQASQKVNNPAAVVDFLKSVTLRDVLPPPPPVVPRRFMWADASMVWLTSLIWGEIYVRGMTPLGIWANTSVRLFYVKHAQPQPRAMAGTVSSVVGGLLGRSSEPAQNAR